MIAAIERRCDPAVLAAARSIATFVEADSARGHRQAMRELQLAERLGAPAAELEPLRAGAEDAVALVFRDSVTNAFVYGLYVPGRELYLFMADDDEDEDALRRIASALAARVGTSFAIQSG